MNLKSTYSSSCVVRWLQRHFNRPILYNADYVTPLEKPHLLDCDNVGVSSESDIHGLTVISPYELWPFLPRSARSAKRGIAIVGCPSVCLSICNVDQS